MQLVPATRKSVVLQPCDRVGDGHQRDPFMRAQEVVRAGQVEDDELSPRGSLGHAALRRPMARRGRQRLTVSAASVPAAARTAACGIAMVRSKQPTTPYQEKIGEARRFGTGNWSARAVSIARPRRIAGRTTAVFMTIPATEPRHSCP